jgi:hypothetical protein
MKLPPAKAIRDILEGMLGRDVEVSPGKPLTTIDAVGGAVAVYVDDSSQMRAVLAWDLPAAASVGAAVGLVPARAAAAAVEDRYLPESLMENVAEVSNVLASAFQIEDNPHLRLGFTNHPVAAAGDDVIALLYRMGNRLDLNLEVSGYGPGRMAISMTF